MGIDFIVRKPVLVTTSVKLVPLLVVLFCSRLNRRIYSRTQLSTHTHAIHPGKEANSHKQKTWPLKPLIFGSELILSSVYSKFLKQVKLEKRSYMNVCDLILCDNIFSSCPPPPRAAACVPICFIMTSLCSLICFFFFVFLFI